MRQKTFFLPLLALALAAATAFGEIHISGETKYKEHKLVKLDASGDIAGAALIWDVNDEDNADIEATGPRFRMAAPPGVYKVKLRAIRLGKDGMTTLEEDRRTITVEGVVPPMPPVPPGPGPSPGPTPPGPTPPAPAAGKMVLIVYETSEAAKLPEKQQQILYSRAVREYLNAHTDTEPDGKTHAWRIFDKDIDTTAESKSWQEAMRRTRTAVPWLIISNGKTGYEGPLPATVDEFMTLAKKYLEG